MAGALNLLKALVEPVRIRLYLLLKQSTLTVSELSEILEISQSNTSHHVKALRDLGLLSAEKTGQHTYYALNPQRMQEKPVVAILRNLEEIGAEIPELRSDAAKLRTVLAARSSDTLSFSRSLSAKPSGNTWASDCWRSRSSAAAMPPRVVPSTLARVMLATIATVPSNTAW